MDSCKFLKQIRPEWLRRLAGMDSAFEQAEQECSACQKQKG